jgi:hypothetical protein
MLRGMADRSGVEARESRIHGVGLFATRAFAPGERILRRKERTITPRAPLREDERWYHCDDLEGGRRVVLGYPERHLNHCCDPNAYIAQDDGATYIVARRNIGAGEEITNDYCMNSTGDTLWECNCGHATCRREIHADFFHLPLGKQRKYRPLLMRWFVEEHRAQIEALDVASS